ncbi:MAG: hypothetical protein LUP96_06640 [Methylococcaceae bacterium]|nr:hypothetical protein [Methylococcaceae bacterium]
MKIIKILLCTALIIATGCTELTLKQQYQKAVKDAAIVKTKEKTNTLLAITPNNSKLIWNEDKTKLLVVTWKSRGVYDKFVKNKSQASSDPNHILWVSVAPQVKAFCQAYEHDTDEELNVRLKQYLGLAPDWQYDVFVEMWVSPEHLFRPCVDPEINDTQCETNVPDKFPTKITSNRIPENYDQFYKNLYFKSFRGEDKYRAPWTGLGYTYDWGNDDSDIGASEFILMPNAPYQIKQVLTTHEYCAKPH